VATGHHAYNGTAVHSLPLVAAFTAIVITELYLLS